MLTDKNRRLTELRDTAHRAASDGWLTRREVADLVKAHREVQSATPRLGRLPGLVRWLVQTEAKAMDRQADGVLARLARSPAIDMWTHYAWSLLSAVSPRRGSDVIPEAERQQYIAFARPIMEAGVGEANWRPTRPGLRDRALIFAEFAAAHPDDFAHRLGFVQGEGVFLFRDGGVAGLSQMQRIDLELPRRDGDTLIAEVRRRLAPGARDIDWNPVSIHVRPPGTWLSLWRGSDGDAHVYELYMVPGEDTAHVVRTRRQGLDDLPPSESEVAVIDLNQP